MADVRKTIPNELLGNAKYSVRLRSLNSFGVPSDWSEALVVDTSASAAGTARRVVITEDGMLIYDQYGQLVFGFFGSETGNRTNHVKNPSFESNITGWIANPASTLTRDTTKYLYGQPGLLACAKVTCSSNNATGVGLVQDTVHRTTLSAGNTVTASCYVNPTVLNKFQIGTRFYNGAGAVISDQWSPNEINAGSLTWTRLTVVGAVAPAGTATVGVVVRSTRAMALNETFNVDGVLLEKSAILREYFDGSTSAGNTSWAGAAHLSESLMVINAPNYQNGPVITQSTIQTGPFPEVGGGIKLDPTGLYGYNTLGVQKVHISATTGNITATDGVFTGSTFQTSATVGLGSPNAGAGVVFNATGIKGYSGTGTTPSFEVSTTGQMTALSGSIGGWTINSTNLSNSNVILGSGGTITLGTGNNIAKLSSNDASGYRLWIGHSDPLSAPFKVRQDGTFIAEGAEITGTIDAETGTIGGWTVDEDSLTGGNVTLDSIGEIRAGTGNNVAVMSSNHATYRMWAGNADPTLAPFRVTQDGGFTSSFGVMAGITIGPDRLTVGTGSNVAGMRAGTDPGDVVFFAGNEDPDFAPFQVKNDGTVVAEFVLTPTVDGNFIWHAGNDGAGSGLDADLLDGQHGSFYRDGSNLNAGTIPGARLAGAYSGINQVGTLGTLDVTGAATFNTTPTVGGNAVWHAGNDGAGSTMDADLLDGQHGAYYLDWTNTTSKPDPVVTVSLTGPVTGSANQVWTDLSGNVTLSIATTVVGGPGSNINADQLDGLDSTYFLNATNITSGTLGNGRLSGTYTINITGNVTGSVTGNASTATALQTARTIAGKTFDGTQNVTLSTLTRGTYLTGGNYDGSTNVTWAVDATSTNTVSKVVARDASGDFAAGVITASRFISSVAIGTAPFTVTSTTKVINLNADLLDGLNSDDFAYREEVEALTGDLMNVGLYDAASYNGEKIDMTFTGIAGQGMTIVGTTAVDSSYDIRLDCTRPNVASGSQRPLSDGTNQLTIVEFTTTSVILYIRRDNSTWLSVTFTYASQANFPAVGQRLHLRLTWNKTTDVRTAYWRPAGPATDLLNNDDWVNAGSATTAGAAIVSGARTITINSQATFYYTGKFYRVTVDDDGASNIIDFSNDNIPNPNSTSATATSGQTVTIPAGVLTTTYPKPVWSGGTTTYRHGMYWVAGSSGPLDFVDSDFSGRYEVDADETVNVYEGDWIIAIDPDLGDPGHELGTDQPLSQMTFQFIGYSTETFVKSQIQEHREEVDPHPAAGYVKLDQANLLFAPIVHDHDDDITAAILLHEAALNPHTQYLTEPEGNDLYLSINANFDSDILEFIADHEAKDDPHPQYLVEAEGNLRYETIGSVTAHEAKEDPHPQYVTLSEGNVAFEPAGAVATHEARADPHPQYMTTSEGDARFAAFSHDHNLIYFTKTEIVNMFGNLEEDVLSTDGAQSSRIWVGSEKPADPGIGDILIRTPNVALQEPGIVPAFVATSSSPTIIELDWNPWPAGASVTTIDLEWSANGTTGWAAVTGSPLDDLIVEYQDTVAGENTIRYYRIRGNNLTGPGSWSNVLMGKSANAAPPPPTSLVIGTVTPSTIQLSWTAPSWSDPGAVNGRYEMIRNGGSVGFAPGGNISNKALTSNVATLTTSAAHGLSVGDTVLIAGVDATFNGTYVITSIPLTTTFTYAKTAANVASTAATGTYAAQSYKFTGLIENTAYTLAVRSKDSGAMVSTTASIGPNASTTTTNGAPVEVVTGISVSASTTLPQASVSWTNPTLPVDFSYLEVQIIRSSDSAVLGSAIGISSTTTKTITELPWGTAVKGRVRVVDQGGLQGPWVTTAGTATIMADPVPGTPSPSVNKTDVTVTWTAPAALPSDFTGYRIYEYQGPSGTTALSSTPKGSNLSHTYTALPYATQRRYRVIAERSGSLSPSFTAYSSSVTTLANPIPTSPNLAVTSLNTLTATWAIPTAGEPNDSTVYRVRLKNSAGSVLNETTVAYTATQQVVWTNQSYSTTYKFDVRLERSNGQHSSYSTEASATTGAHPDTTAPANANVTSWKPEGSYGAMYVRATMPADVDFAQYSIDTNDGNGSEYTAIGWTTASPSASVVHGILTSVAGRTVYVRVNVRDALNNTRIGPWFSYTLLASPYAIGPDAGGTWRPETGGWRDDATRSPNEIAHGRTTSGNNYGCWFYGTKISDAMNGRTITQAYVETWREDEGGSGGAISPLFWTHNLLTRSGDPTVQLSDQGVSEANRLGTAIARNFASGFGGTDGYWFLHTPFITALTTGTARGLCIYRPTAVTDATSQFSYYMLLGAPNSVGGNPNLRVSGKIYFTHLG